MKNDNTTSNTDEIAAGEAQQLVGQLLRETRERAGLDVAEAARALRIGKRYLEALEDGRNHDLPGVAYAIGFVRSYAEHLKLDGEEIVRRYKAEAQDVDVKADLTFPKPIPDSGVPGAAVLGLGIIVAALAYGVWYWNSNADDMTVERVEAVPEHMAAPAEKAAPAARPEVAAVAEPTPTPEPAPEAAPEPEAVVEVVAEEVAVAVAEEAPQEETPPAAEAAVIVEEAAQAVEPAEVEAEAPAAEPVVEAAVEDVAEVAVEPIAEPVAEAVTETPTVEAAAPEAAAPESGAEVAAAAPAADEGASRITVRAKSNSWIQIRDEALDRLLFTRLLREGDVYEVPDRAGLRLMTGNAGALELLVDGDVIPAIGAIGEVRRNVELDPDKLKSGTAVTE